MPSASSAKTQMHPRAGGQLTELAEAATLPIDMPKRELKHVTIIGVGLVGGSAGLAIKAYEPTIRVAGVGRRRSSLDAALAAGAIDTAHLDVAEAAEILGVQEQTVRSAKHKAIKKLREHLSGGEANK